MKRIYFSGSEPWWPPACRIGGIGLRETMSPQHVNRPEGMPYWLIVAFDHPADVLLDEKIRTIGPAALVVWPPARCHFFGKATGRWTHTWLYGSGPAWDLACSSLPQEQPILLDGTGFHRLIEALYHEIIEHPRPDPNMLQNLVELIATHIRRLAPLPLRQPRSAGSLARACDLIQRRMHHPLSLADLARAAGLSVSQFSFNFRRAHGMSPMAYLRRQRLQRAARLLENHTLSIKEIAAQAGYPDPLHFSREFRRVIGHPPTRHRALAQSARTR